MLFDGDTRLLFRDGYCPWTLTWRTSRLVSAFDSIFRHVGYEGLPDLAAVKDFILSAVVTEGHSRVPRHIEEIRRRCVWQAFQRVLDDPGAAAALRHPVLKPLLGAVS